MNIRSTCLTVLGVLVGTVATGCGGDGGERNEPVAPVLEEARSDLAREAPNAALEQVQALADANAAFGLELLQAQNTAENFFFSPHSISTALAMVYPGALGNTKAEMRTTLHFPEADQEVLDAFNSLEQKLAGRGQGKRGADDQPFRLRVSNALWGERDFEFNSGYLDVIAKSFGAGINLVDFRNEFEASRHTINAWVNVQTESRIPELLKENIIKPTTRLVLTNTVYFNAAWSAPFEKERTENGAFTLNDGTTRDVPLMHGASSVYAEGEGWKATELTYDGGEVSMLLILPDPGTFETFRTGFNAERLGQIRTGLADGYQVALTLPRFEMRSHLSVADSLESLGMKAAFGPGAAEFHGMESDPREDLFISDVIHEAFVKVNEAGTEATAATAVIMEGVSSAPPPPKLASFDARSPFLFAIRDRETGAVLFVGQVANPAE